MAGTDYWYNGGVYYGWDAGQYEIVAPPPGAVVPAPPPSCSTVDFGGGKTYDCGGAFYSKVPNGWRVIPPPIGAKVTSLPNGAVNQTVAGTTYNTFGGAWSKPVYLRSGVIYDVVTKPAVKAPGSSALA